MIIIRPATIDDAAFVSSTIAETDYLAWSSVTTYALDDRVIVIAANVHKVYQSLQASNTNHDPATSPTWWLEVGSTNRWRMFDDKIQSQSTATGQIVVEITPASRADAIALMNIDASSVNVTVTDAFDGVVFDRTVNLNSTSGIVDWYSYFFEPIERLTDFVLTDLPPYYSPTIKITLVGDPAGTVAVGAIIAGQQQLIGGSQYGAKMGITDYSVKQQDSFGNYTVLQRAYRKTGSIDVEVDIDNIGAVHRLLTKYRSKPLVFFGVSTRDDSAIYGFYKDYFETISYPTFSVFSFELEGLT